MTSCFVNRLVLELYRRGFEDKDGDLSDQPVTALTACEGSFSFVLVDKERDAILVARSIKLCSSSSVIRRNERRRRLEGVRIALPLYDEMI